MSEKNNDTGQMPLPKWYDATNKNIIKVNKGSIVQQRITSRERKIYTK